MGRWSWGLVGCGLLWAGAALAAFKTPEQPVKNAFAPLLDFSETNFNKALAPQWRQRFRAGSRQGAWQIYYGSLGGFRQVAIGLCRNRVVHLYASLGPGARPAGLQNLVRDYFSDDLVRHVLLVEDSREERYILLKSKREAAICGK